MANLNFNKVILAGRLTADPELRTIPSGASVTTFGIAVNRRNARQQTADPNQVTVDFFNVTAWRERAEFVTRYFRKGSSILIVGTIQNRTWTDQQGQKHYATDIIADEVNFVDAKGEGPAIGSNSVPAQSAEPGNYSAPSYSTPADVAPKFEEMSNDDDLPF